MTDIQGARENQVYPALEVTHGKENAVILVLLGRSEHRDLLDDQDQEEDTQVVLAELR